MATEDTTDQAHTQDTATPEPASSAPQSPAEWRTERRDYYVRVTHRLITAVSVLAVVVLLNTSVQVYDAARGPTVQNFAVTDDLRVQELTALDEPLVTEQGLRNWTADALRSLYTYDFVHYRDQFNDARHLFTTNDAFTSFLSALQQAGTLETVRRNKLVVSAILRDPPNIENAGMLNGRYSWRLEVPVSVRYESASDSMTQQLAVRVIVQRVPQTENPRGLGISQIIAPRS